MIHRFSCLEALNSRLVFASFICTRLNPLQVDYIPYLDSLAVQMGARPNILWFLIKDPKLALQLFFGPCTPYQYRLTGPGKWAGARQAILTQWERVVQPFRTRVVPEPEPRSSRHWRISVALSGAVLLCCVFYRKDQLLSYWASLPFIRSPE